MVDPFKLIRLRPEIEPCEKTKYILSLAGGVRTFNLSDIPNREGFCAWCDGPLSGRKVRWCSDDCVHTAMDYCSPQNPGPKIKRLIYEQECACRICGELYEDFIKERILKLFKMNNRHKPLGEEIILVTPYQLGAGTGDIWHVDHILPISWGGDGINPENLQVICVKCHKYKTREERIYERTHKKRNSKD